jgi:hypothetical protein
VSDTGFTAGSAWAMLLAWQRVVYERPPPASLRRGLVALPRGVTAALVLVALVALLAWALRRRYRRPR